MDLQDQSDLQDTQKIIQITVIVSGQFMHRVDTLSNLSFGEFLSDIFYNKE